MRVGQLDDMSASLRLEHTVYVLRHRRERKSKCSLEPLRLAGWQNLHFFESGADCRIPVAGFIELCVDGPELSVADAGRPLLLLDSTWRLLPTLRKCLDGETLPRSLPSGVHTAYPRVSKVHADPAGGLASVEALYLALRIMGEDRAELLADYYWKDAFLSQFHGGIL